MNKKVAQKKVEKFLRFLEHQLDKQYLTVPEFADKMGVPKATVYTWLNRKSVMSLENYYKALEVLGLKEEIVEKTETTQGSEQAVTPAS